MLNKIVCPKCGQLYNEDAERCPLCGLPAQPRPAPAAAPQRRRVTEVERQQRQKDQRRDAADERRRQKQAKLLADAEEERRLQAAEEQERLEKKRRKLARRGYSEEEIRLQLSMEKRRVPDVAVLPDRRRVPALPLLFSILFLVIAIVIGGSFLLWKANILEIGIYEYLSTVAGKSEPKEATCTGIELSDDELRLTAEQETYKLRYTLTPEDCSLPVSFQSSDPSVIEVDEFGVITALAPGQASVSVSCGEMEARCAVTCSFAETETVDPATLDLPEGLELSATDITFFGPGENTYLHVNNVPNGVEIVWSSSDDAIATVESNGHVVAVADGLCYVTAVVGEYAASCTVRCNFPEADD